MPETPNQSAGSSEPTMPSVGLTVVTFNMQNRMGEGKLKRRKRLEGIATLLMEQSPDIVCLQECLYEDFILLDRALGARHSGFTPRDDGNRLGEGNPVFATSDRWEQLAFNTFWLSATPQMPSRSWRSAHHRIASVMRLRGSGIESASLVVVNVHLDHRSALARRKSLVLIRRELGRLVGSGSDAVIVCGDFNIRPQRLYRSGFVFQDLNQGSEIPITLEDAAAGGSQDWNEPTFRGIGKFGLFRRRLDYCLHGSSLACQRYSVVDPVIDGRWLSDHRLVVASFSRKETCGSRP